MKKLTEFLKPNVLIIFGALLFVYYLNFLSYDGAGLALGISAIVISAFYLFAGIFLVVAGNKPSQSVQKTFHLLSVVLFAAFMFVDFLLTTINATKVMGPTAWTIKIVSMVTSLAFIMIFVISKFSSESTLLRLNNLFSLIFVLVLVLDVLFSVSGNPNALGNINVLLVVIYGFYSYYLFGSCEKTEVLPKQTETEEKSVK